MRTYSLKIEFNTDCKHKDEIIVSINHPMLKPSYAIDWALLSTVISLYKETENSKLGAKKMSDFLDVCQSTFCNEHNLWDEPSPQ